jgi:hypothetical protein
MPRRSTRKTRLRTSLPRIRWRPMPSPRSP